MAPAASFCNRPDPLKEGFLMLERWKLHIFENRQEVFAAELSGPAILGRQDKGQREDGPYWKKQENGVWRVVIASVEEDVISRKQIFVEPLTKDKVKLTNLGKKHFLVNGNSLNPEASCEVSLPAALVVGNKALRIGAGVTEDPGLQSLAGATRAPGVRLLDTPNPFTVSVPLNEGMDPEALIRWIQALLGVLQSAAGSTDFFARAARAIVDLVGLDSGRVLVREQDAWIEQACQTTASRFDVEQWQPSLQVLGKLLEEKKTFWQLPGSATHSLVGVKAVVAAPILDKNGNVIGALYGERRRQSSEIAARAISKLEAMLVEVLASGVAAGLARVEEEKAALRTRVQFEQFFSPNLARQLADNPDLLQGKTTELSILFCDIRGFSRISERLGPAGTTHWISDVMEALSECVWEHEGVVLEYVGDEIRGMWGAPNEQPEHARLACRAGLAMQKRLPQLSEFWQPVLGEPLKIGIGINTESAWVGNVGSPRKFKYGPQGNAMSLASRVQGSTKYIKSNLLITQSTQAQLGPGFATRRLCRVRVVNIAQAVDLYELVEPNLPGWSDLKEEYEEALAHFEKKNFSQAAHILSKLLIEHPNDGPSLILMSRAVQGLVEEPTEFDPVWELPGK
jgi:adenylate cyclase